MLKKTITYTDLNGTERTEDHYFNLTKAEMLEYDASFYPSSAIEYLTYLVEAKEAGKLVLAFKDLILRSYGKRTADGLFIKNQQLRDAFMASEAYSELFMEVTTSEENAAAFINGVVPQVPQSGGTSTNVVSLG